MKNSLSILVFLSVLLATITMVVVNFKIWSNPKSLHFSNNNERSKQNWTPPNHGGKSLQPTDKEKTQITHLINRPLFSPTRRLTTKSKPAPQKRIKKQVRTPIVKAIFDPKKFRVKGVLMQNSQRKVLISTPGFKNGKWLTIGDTIQSWKISRITETTIVVSQGLRRISLSLYVEKSQ